MTSELFRFICARPATKESRSIAISPPPREFIRKFNARAAASSTPLDPGEIHLKYGDNINTLSTTLNLSPLDTGLGKRLEAHKVRKSIDQAFPEEDLSQLVGKDEWREDEATLNHSLHEIWVAGSDPSAIGPLRTLQRQMYDLVHQVASQTSDQKGGGTFYLQGLEVYESPQPISDENTTNERSTQEARTSSVEHVSTVGEDLQDDPIPGLIEVLDFLESDSILRYFVHDIVSPTTAFLVSPNWLARRTQQAQTATVNALSAVGAVQPYPNLEITIYYDAIIQAIKSAKAKQASQNVQAFKAGLFSIGSLQVEINKPWASPIFNLTTRNVSRTALPTPHPSKVKSAHVGDLLVVRDNVKEYVRGEIGNIENVLKSEQMVRETKRLDRTKTVVVTRTSTEDEEERDQQTTSRFALNQEASNVIKSDASLKAGLTTSASYGPTVRVQGSLSTATNNSTTTSNKVASQYSQDVTSRAASKVIEKTFNSTTTTTISQFQENFRHEFTNTDPKAQNISGIYQWVNKVSQCRMYNYGKRLLLDIVVPEPANLLISQNNSRPNLEKPTPLTESAVDLNESNYSEIAGRYQTTGIAPPDAMLTSVSYSFKPEGTEDRTPKAASLVKDVAVPKGYLCYCANIKVGMRVGLNGPMNIFLAVAGQDISPPIRGSVEADNKTFGQLVFFDRPFLTGKVAVSVTSESFFAFSGNIALYCIRDPQSFATWQQKTYDQIQTAYAKLKMDYDRSVTETTISQMNVVSGNNPLENVTIVNNELKRSSIAFITGQNFEAFGTTDPNVKSPTNPSGDGIPEVKDFEEAMKQGHFADFFEKAFEWENMQYILYPYFWGSRANWYDRIGFQSTDPSFSDFVKAGAALVTVPARLGFCLEVIHYLETGKIWKAGPVSTLAGSRYYSMAQEILKAEAHPTDTTVSDPWYTVVPTDLVQLRENSVLPKYHIDQSLKPSEIWTDDTDPNPVKDH